MAKKSSKVFLIVASGIIGLVTIAGIAVSIFYKPYMAVYLVTGDMYFGKTNVFPCVKIQDPWFLQRTEDGSLTLEKFTDAVWAPDNGMKINRKHIIFMSKLSESSPIVSAIEGRGASEQILSPMGTDSDLVETEDNSLDINED